MRKKRTTIIALCAGMLCAICIFLFLETIAGNATAAQAEALAKYGGEQIEVCVAKRDIAAGERIDSGALEMKLYATSLLPADAITDNSQIIGKTATQSIFAGEVVNLHCFDQAADALEVPDGLVALSVPAKPVQAIGGALEPGMCIDVYASGDAQTTALMRNVQILSTSVSSSQSSQQADLTWITLALKPERVQEMIAASQRTTLYFSLPSQSVLDDEGFDDYLDGKLGAQQSASAENADSEDRGKEED